MIKAAIKNFAIWARVQLIESAKQRAFEYEITGNEYSDGSYTYTGTWSLVSAVPGITVTSDGIVKVEACS